MLFSIKNVIDYQMVKYLAGYDSFQRVQYVKLQHTLCLSCCCDKICMYMYVNFYRLHKVVNIDAKLLKITTCAGNHVVLTSNTIIFGPAIFVILQ